MKTLKNEFSNARTPGGQRDIRGYEFNLIPYFFRSAKGEVVPFHTIEGV
jgi:hypothetical protein